jgi:hypothetical protein
MCRSQHGFLLLDQLLGVILAPFPFFVVLCACRMTACGGLEGTTASLKARIHSACPIQGVGCHSVIHPSSEDRWRTWLLRARAPLARSSLSLTGYKGAPCLPRWRYLLFVSCHCASLFIVRFHPELLLLSLVTLLSRTNNNNSLYFHCYAQPVVVAPFYIDHWTDLFSFLLLPLTLAARSESLLQSRLASITLASTTGWPGLLHTNFAQQHIIWST